MIQGHILPSKTCAISQAASNAEWSLPRSFVNFLLLTRLVSSSLQLTSYIISSLITGNSIAGSLRIASFILTFLPLNYSEPFPSYSPVQWRVARPLVQRDLLDCLHSINPRPFDLNRFFFHVLISHNCKQYSTISQNSKLYFYFFLFIFSYLSHCAARGYGAAHGPRAKPLVLNDLPRYHETKKTFMGWQFVPSPIRRSH